MHETLLARTITDLAQPLAASLELAIWGVEVMQGKSAIVRVYVEGENGVSIDACAELSRLLGLTLDVEDLVTGAYVLEVSSPGLERTFFTPEQLAASLGMCVAITLHTPTAAYPGRKNILGTLTAASDTFSVVPLDVPATIPGDAPMPATFAWDDVKKAKRVYFPPETPGPAKGKKQKTTSPTEHTLTGDEDKAVSQPQTRPHAVERAVPPRRRKSA